MPTFDVKPSLPGAAITFSIPSAATIDLGVVVNRIGRASEHRDGVLVVRSRLATDADIDREIDQLIEDLKALRPKAKQLLGSLKR
jgi:hypothetical protein